MSTKKPKIFTNSKRWSNAKLVSVFPAIKLTQHENGQITAGMGADQRIDRILERIHSQVVNGNRKSKNQIKHDIDDYKKTLATIRKQLNSALKMGLKLNDSRTLLIQEFLQAFYEDHDYQSSANKQLERRIHDVSPIRELLELFRKHGVLVKNTKDCLTTTKATILSEFKEMGLKDLTADQDADLHQKIQRTLSNHFSTKQT